MNYKETIQYLYDSLPVFHRIGKAAYKANLDNSTALDNYFGNPHNAYPTVHIAGTNGKGSVSHIIASVLQSAGYKTGLYTSPHLFDFGERIKINGRQIAEQAVVDFVEKNRRYTESLKPSFFELTSTMAFCFFAESKVDVAVIETGLGGRLDSTNIITPKLSVITNIGFDHTDFLGNTLGKIAVEKAGIIKPGVPAIVGERHAETDGVFVERAKECNAPLWFAEDCFEIRSIEKPCGKQVFDVETADDTLFDDKNFRIELDLEGDYQKKNLLTALCAVAVMQKTGFGIDFETVRRGFADAASITGLNGRWQTLQKNPTVICDTGHNVHGLTQTMKQLRDTEHENLFFVLGVMNDKDLSSIVPLLPKNARYFYTQASVPRAMNAELLAQKCGEAGLSGEVEPDIPTAVRKAIARASARDLVFIGGSTYVVAETVV